ncbi:ATP-binding cassette sub-family A member 3-like [Brachionus plicatilis]|uniref:ATP-binding cassette sub-family A member 3-like n=1 Tax=Brachionus plicatilis TaxID=10195 RepID=A0A3M7PRQ4_BRAPC|nr:ATP-binding cassette sub-family A member 3-like [Brachionus plicatilis]
MFLYYFIEKLFSSEMTIISGRRLLVQQIIALLKKRFRISTRRYLLTITVFLLPIIVQTLSTALIPPNTNLVNKNDNTLRYSGRIKLDIENYENFRMPYHIVNNSYSDIPLRSLLQKFYTTQNRPNIQLLEIKSENISHFVQSEKEKNTKNLINDLFMAISFNITNWDTFQATLFYSTLAFHSSATILNEATNLLLTFLSKDVAKSITTTNAPLRSNNSLYQGGDLLEFLACLDIVPGSILNLVISLLSSFLIAANAINISREFANGSKKLQHLSRTNKFTYWLSNYLYDLPFFVVIFVCVVSSMKIVDAVRNDALVESAVLASQSNIFYVFFLLIFSSFPSCTLSYVWSFFFKTEILAFISLFIMLSSAVVLDMLCSFIQLFISSDPLDRNEGLLNFLATFKDCLFFFLPNCMEFSNRLLATSFSLDAGGLSFEQPGIGSIIVVFLFQFFIGNLVIVALEPQIDQVGALVLKDIGKKYGRKKSFALKDISITVKQSECFGLTFDLQKNFYQYLFYLDQLKEFFSKSGYINTAHGIIEN